MKRLGWPWLVHGLALFHFCLSYCSQSRPFLDLDRYLAFAERMPYQARVLPALLFHALTSWVPLPSLAFGPLLPAHLSCFFIATSVLSVFTSVILVRDIGRRHLGHSPLTRELTTVALILGICFTYLVGYELKFFLPYDLPSLALWSLGIWLAYQRWTWCLPLWFAMATLNRETTLVLIPCLMAIHHHRHRMPLSRNVLMAGLLLAIWLAAKYLTYQHFQHNPRDGNGLALNNLGKNLHYLINPLHWPQLAATWGFLGIPLALQWRRITDPCLRAFKWTVLGTLALLCVTGVVIEVRIFGELTLLVVLCLSSRIEAALASLRPS